MGWGGAGGVGVVERGNDTGEREGGRQSKGEAMKRQKENNQHSNGVGPRPKLQPPTAIIMTFFFFFLLLWSESSVPKSLN